MIKVDQKVITTIEKIRNYVEATGLNKDTFPLESIVTLVEVTIGGNFWKCISDKIDDSFSKTAKLYEEGFKNALEKEDVEGCIYLLNLFEYNYRSLLTALSDEERYARERPYKKQIIQIGEAYAKIQYRLHQDKQKELESPNVKLMEGRGVVYTCLLKDEELYQPDNLDSQIEYLCFTDDEEKWGDRDGVWKYCKLENPDGLEPEMLRTKCRILAHELLPEYDYSIWVERDYKVAGEINLFCEVYGNGNSFLGFAQSSKDCMYEDMLYTDMGSDDRNIAMRKKIHAYKKEGYPQNNGLIDDRIMIRNHKDAKMCKVMEEWWDMVQNANDDIDTTYFNYVAWKNQYPFSICDLFIYYNPYFMNMDVNLDPHEEI